MKRNARTSQLSFHCAQYWQGGILSSLRVPPLNVPLELCQPGDRYVEGIAGLPRHRAGKLFLTGVRRVLGFVLVIEQILPVGLRLRAHPTLTKTSGECGHHNTIFHNLRDLCCILYIVLILETADLLLP